MEDEKALEQDVDVAEETDVLEEEYEIEAEDTEDLDLAMREALEAVEREEERLDEAAGTDRGEQPGDDAGDEFGRLQAELADLRDRSVRTLADFDNYRKRVARERRDEQRYAGFELVREMLSVVDNLERALAAEGSAEDLKTGVEMTYRQLLDLLRQHGVHRVPAAGEPFDPAVHEAVARFEDLATTVPTVSEELQSGFQMHDRLLRPSMVRVAMPAKEPDGAPDGERGGDHDPE